MRTASGATAVQIIQHANNKRVVVKHIGSAHTDDELAALRSNAEQVCEQLSPQLSLLSSVESPRRLMHADYLNLHAVTHCFAHDAIQAHVLICFMALMIRKFLEIKTGLSLQRVRDIIFRVHEAHIEDTLTGKKFILQTNLSDYNNSGIADILKLH